ncbi:MAG: helix-turn-helix domain-containing protein [Candidatus Magasanikbacteria bacterium]|nr:helix-turn-helix domain-containing protein [Candidatus Magasanikbacteria bacterium]
MIHEVNEIYKDLASSSTPEVPNTLWLSVSETAKMGGVTAKTIRRAIQEKKIRYSVNGNRYKIDFMSVVNYLYSNTKLKNKFNQFGVGQYVEEWKKA